MSNRLGLALGDPKKQVEDGTTIFDPSLLKRFVSNDRRASSSVERVRKSASVSSSDGKADMMVNYRGQLSKSQ